jgi:hypothetical protein
MKLKYFANTNVVKSKPYQTKIQLKINRVKYKTIKWFSYVYLIYNEVNVKKINFNVFILQIYKNAKYRNQNGM